MSSAARPQSRPEGPVGGHPRDQESAETDVHGRVEYERGSRARRGRRARPARRPVEVDCSRGAERSSERPRLDGEACEDGCGQEDVCSKPGRAREDPERRVVTHSRPPTSRARPSRVTSSAGIRSASACATAASSPARKRASQAPRPRQRCGRRPSSGGDPTPPAPRSRGRSGGGSSRQRSSNAAGRSRSSRDPPPSRRG